MEIHYSANEVNPRTLRVQRSGAIASDRAKRDCRRQCMENSLQKLTEEKNKIFKISFFNLYGFHLINDSRGKHYMYINKDDRIEDKLTYLSKFKDKFTITRGIASNKKKKEAFPK